jgi:hypothetical protein
MPVLDVDFAGVAGRKTQKELFHERVVGHIRETPDVAAVVEKPFDQIFFMK